MVCHFGKILHCDLIVHGHFHDSCLCHAGNCIFCLDHRQWALFSFCVNLNIHFSCLHLFIYNFFNRQQLLYFFISGHRFSFPFSLSLFLLFHSPVRVLRSPSAPFCPHFPGLPQEVPRKSADQIKSLPSQNCNFQMPPVHRYDCGCAVLRL